MASTRRVMLTVATAGSALIQACEKAGVTVPRYVQFKVSLIYTDVLQILLP
jgi:hypothetical protein